MFREETIADLNVAVGPAHGPPLIMLHGVCRSWSDFMSIAPTLAARWQLYLVDHRGHGNSPRRDRYLVMDYVDDAAQVIEALDQPVAVYGHSLGALVAAGVAARLAGRVRGVVLEDPPFHSMGDRIGQTPLLEMFTAFAALRRQHADGREHDQSAIDQLAAELAEIRIGGTRLGDLRDPTGFRFAARCMLAMASDVLDPIVASDWLAGYDPEQIATEIGCPVLLFQADQAAGGMLNQTDVDMFCARAPQTLLVPTPGIGHLIHATSADLVLRHVWPFLESIC